jgi:small subunit ribosomal protein S16
MVVIRLSRGGSKKRPFYHIVVSDRREARDGRCIERIGYFNPHPRGKDVPLLIDVERVRYWVSKGAQPSDRVHGLIKTAEKTAQNATAA